VSAPQPQPCRSCGAPVSRLVADLGMQPLSNAYVEAEALTAMEPFYPLRALVCGECFLVQIGESATPESIFTEYAYFSSYSDSWLRHAAAFAESAIARLDLGPDSQVVEIASNDGYLLRNFVARGIPCLGVEPAANVAAVAEAAGVPTLVRFFGRALGEELAATSHRADLVVANNVLAHVPDIRDFVAGLAAVLAPGGTATLEFPHLLRLLEENQFDTIYHEHFSYLSLATVERILGAYALAVYDVEELPTHGGSLRLWVAHAETARPTPTVAALREREQQAGITRLETYDAFAERVQAAKRALLRFLIDAREAGERVVAYGAAAKGNTLLNYCGVRTDLVDYAVDRSPHKQGRYLPGSHIPIRSPERIYATRPDYLLILPWNLREEIVEQMAAVREWGCRFVVPIPTTRVLD
jgi:SAM-dependent methyltransferase